MIASVIDALRASGLRNDGHAVGHRLDAGQRDRARREGAQQHQRLSAAVPSASSWASSDSVVERDRAEVLDEDPVAADDDQQHQHDDVEVGRRGEQRAGLLQPAQVGQRHDDDHQQAQRHPPLGVEVERRLDGEHAARDGDGDGEDVVGEQRRPGHERRQARRGSPATRRRRRRPTGRRRSSGGTTARRSTSRTATTMAIGTSLSKAATPTPAWSVSTRTISSVAYAVDEMASDAKIGSATRLRSRWWPSSDVAIGRPMRIRLASETIGSGRYGRRRRRTPAHARAAADRPLVHSAAVHVVVVGCGRVGSSLARALTGDGHTRRRHRPSQRRVRSARRRLLRPNRAGHRLRPRPAE